jgi:CheY-like chemotaxis protein
MNVLLVDDEAMMRRMLRLTLQKRGLQVFEAASGADALAHCEQHPIDVLVTDIVMEEMDGWTLAESVGERCPRLPVLFMSGHPIDFEEHRHHYARCAFLPKPFQPEELVEAISALAGAAA